MLGRVIPNSTENFTFSKASALVICKKSSSDNFGVKAAQIADRKFIRIASIRMNLRSLAVDDFSELSRSKLLQELLLQTTGFATGEAGVEGTHV